MNAKRVVIPIVVLGAVAVAAYSMGWFHRTACKVPAPSKPETFASAPRSAVALTRCSCVKATPCRRGKC
jgi:hypothetical protein